MRETSEHLRELAPQVLGAIVRRYGDFSAAEDAVQEALLVAAQHWPTEGLPDNPRGWLTQVAARRIHHQHELHLRTFRSQRPEWRLQRDVGTDAAFSTPFPPVSCQFL